MNRFKKFLISKGIEINPECLPMDIKGKFGQVGHIYLDDIHFYRREIKPMIEWILQLENQNMLQVHYSSGYDRYIFPDSYGNYETNMTRPQRKFMDNSIKVEMLNADGWYRKFYYWLDKDNPNKGIMSQVRIRNQLYGNR